MKKSAFLLASILALLGIGNTSFACMEMDFDSQGTICIDISKNSKSEFELDLDYNDFDRTHSDAYYYILLPNKENGKKYSGGGKLTSRLTDSSTNFNYNYGNYDYDSDIRKIKVYGIINGQIRSIEEYYDFDDGDRSSDNNINEDEDDDDSDNGDTDNFYVTSNDSSPDTDDRVDLTIKARDGSSTDDSYRGDIDFTVYYKTSSSSSWTKTTSSTYYEIDSDYDNGYTFKSSDDGETTLSDFIKFKKNYDYKVVVKDDDDSSIDGEKIFTVGDSSNGSYSNNDTKNLKLSFDQSNPKINERLDLTIKARDKYLNTTDSYRGDINFKFYYKKTSSDTRHQISTSSKSYYEIDNDYKDGYTFKSSDDGQKTLNDFIKFKGKYIFKIVAQDSKTNSINGYTEVNFRTSSSNIDGFTDSQMDRVNNIYKDRNKTVTIFKNKYKNLKNDTDRKEYTDEIYQNIKDIINDTEDREYSNYYEFYDAITDRNKETANRN